MLEVHMPQGVEVQVLSWAPLKRAGFLASFLMVKGLEKVIEILKHEKFHTI